MIFSKYLPVYKTKYNKFVYGHLYIIAHTVLTCSVITLILNIMYMSLLLPYFKSGCEENIN